jgi:adenosylmethionine-8-amino-7-oxononanoate aminotransferase
VPANFDAQSYSRHCAQALEDTIVGEGAETILAFIMEPVGGLATGALVADDDYYTAVRRICDRYGVLLIYDEVMSGAGRTGKFLAAEHWPAGRPDIVTLAKGIAAGYTPMGAVLAPAAMVEALAEAGGFLHGHTYAANPLSCAIGHAVVQEMVAGKMMENAERMAPSARRSRSPAAAKRHLGGRARKGPFDGDRNRRQQGNQGDFAARETGGLQDHSAWH